MDQSSTQEFRNEQYTVQVSREPGCKVVFNIKIGPKASKEIYKSAIKAINKEVSFPGFRKGKAPEEYIVSKYEKALEKEWKEKTLETGFHHAMQLTQIYPIRQESIRNAKVNSLSKESESDISVEFEGLPDVPAIDVSGMQIEQVVADPVKEEKVDQIIEDIRYQLASWATVDDRPVEEGDFIDIDIVSLDNPQELDLKDTRVEVAKGKVGNWLHTLLIGMKIGESRDGISTQDEGHHNPNFKETNVRITLNSISVSTLPAIDDDLAKRAGADTLDAMKERIRKDIGKAHEKEAAKKRRELLIDAIIEKYPFDIPDSLTTKTAHKMINSRIQKLQELGDDSKLTAEALEEMELKVHQEVKKYYQWQFITHKIAEDEKLEVPKEDILGELMQRRYLDPQGGTPSTKTNEEMFGEALNHLMAMRVADYLLEKVDAK